jgi:oligoribonuclease NrnB/cAMP/cGMP phosphodiesterase (DHH superfamily)
MSTPKIEELDVCIYHDPCSDGYGAAWSVWRKFGDKVEYLPGDHTKGKDDEEFWLDKVRDKKVVCFDFSFSRELTEKLHEEAESFQVVDHHKKAFELLGNLTYCHFNMDKSGAVLAWEACNSKEPPVLLRYIQDRDLWKWELEDSTEICAFIDSQPQSFEAWLVLSTMLEESLEKWARIGKAMLDREKMIAKQIVQDVEEWEVCGHRILAVNALCLRPQVLDIVGQLEPRPFCGCYWIKNGMLHWSLRSNYGTEDVSDVASRFPGGGGHAKASGFSTPIEQADFVNRILTPPEKE